MDLKVSITQQGPLLQGKAPEVIQRNLEAMITEMVNILVTPIRAATPVGVSPWHLRDTILTDVQGKGTPLVKGIIATDSEHGLVIEKGRRPGVKMPPSGVLLQWLQEKAGFDEKTALRIEFAVRRKIGKMGFKRWPDGAQMFEATLEKYMPQLQEIAQKYGFALAKELNG